MKVLIIVSCALAVVSAQYGPGPAHGQAPYNGPQHVPVIKDGVPIETPEVQQARANHYAALTDAVNHPAYQHGPQDNGQYNSNGFQGGNQYQQQAQQYSAPTYQQQPQQYSAPAQQYQQQPQQYSAPAQQYQGQGRQVVPAYETSHAYPGVSRDGKPLDTPEVEAAKAHHFSLVSEALSRNTPQQSQHYRQRRGIYAAYPQHIPVIGHNGVPVEPIEVQHARAEHFAAHAAAGHGQNVYAVHAPVYGHHGSYVHQVPAFDHEGHPVDTAEVQHAKAAHFAAYSEAAARNAHPAAHIGYAAQYDHYNGAPVDTPEVQHAKAVHFAAHAAAHHY